MRWPAGKTIETPHAADKTQQRQDLNCLRILNRLARNDRHRTLHVVGSVLTDGTMLVEAPPGSKVITQHKVDGVVVSHGVTEIASFTIEPCTPGQQVDVLAKIELEVEIIEMTAERPWGSLDKRLTVLHRAVFEYVEGLAAYALGWTEPVIDENLPTCDYTPTVEQVAPACGWGHTPAKPNQRHGSYAATTDRHNRWS